MAADLEWERSYHRGWYLFAFGRAQLKLAEKEAVITTLETAKTQTKQQYDPELYVRILEHLRECYFQKGEYLKAFNLKQEQRATEQKYGLRAFTGAGRLQATQQVTNPALALIEQKETVAQEISATGREQDIKRLVERMGYSDRRLTIIYGQSGVGKSSILQAGLIPVLKSKAIGSRDVLPILQQVYTDWAKELQNCLSKAICERTTSPSASIPQVEAKNTPSSLKGNEFGGLGDSTIGEKIKTILDQLEKNADNELLTVLVFDQFEEFFFVYKDPKERLTFYNFLRESLDIPHIRIILSLREDYLYYLLECNERLANFEVINNNILDKDILYYLGNFSRIDARALINNFIQRTKLSLQSSLIDILVEDLAGDFDEIRPIELQIVGSQIQTENITTKEQYQQKGPKEELVGRFLEEVVKDCGEGNEQISKLVLYLLTDENNTRPLKTRADLELELEVQPEKLDLILLILVKSGLVFKVVAYPAERYQLVHDYLVPFVRQQQSERLIAELEKEREQRKLTEASLNKILTKQLQGARKATLTLAGLVAATSTFAITVTIAGINLYLGRQFTSLEQSSQLEFLVANIKLGKELKRWKFGAIPGTYLNVLGQLNEAIYSTKEVNHLIGHKGSVTAVSFSPDDKLIATVSEDKTVKIWSIDGENIQTLPEDRKTITSVSFSADGRFLATASKDTTVKIWDIGNLYKNKLLSPKYQFYHTGNITSMSFSSDGKFLAAGDAGNVKLWEIKSSKSIPFPKPHNNNIISISFSPDGKSLASADSYDTVKIWTIGDKSIKTIENYGAISMRFSPNDNNLVVTNKDKTIAIYDYKKGTLLKKISSYYDDDLHIASLSLDAKLHAFVKLGSYSKNENNVVRISKINSNQSKVNLLGYHNGSINSLSFSHDGKFLASASKDKTVKIWRVDSKTFKVKDDDDKNFYNVKFSPDNKIIAATNYSNNNNPIKIWSLEGSLIKTIEGYGYPLNFSSDGKTLITGSANSVVKVMGVDAKEITLQGGAANISSIALSPDSKIVATASEEKITLWNSNDGSHKITLKKQHKKRINKIGFSKNGKVIFSIGDDNKVNLYENNGTFISTLDGHTEEVHNVTFSNDSQIIATDGDDNLVKLWKRDGTLIKNLSEHLNTVMNVVFSPDSKIIASITQGNDGVKLWRRDGSPLKTIYYPNIDNINFSPDSQIIASTNQDNTIKLWRLDGTFLKNFDKHKLGVNSVEFSPNGKIIASAGDDGKIQLWHTNDDLAKPIYAHSNKVQKLKFSHDGKLLVSVASDNQVKLWNTAGKLIKTLQEGNPDVLSPGVTNYNNIDISQDSKIITFYSSISNRTDYKNNFTVKIWNSQGQEIKKNIQKPVFVDLGNVKSSLDGRKVVFPLPEYALKLWRVDDEKCITSLEGYYPGSKISLSPDSKMIAGVGENNTLMLWNISSMETCETKQANILKGHKDNINDIAFSHNGEIIASASSDKTVKLWNRHGKLFQTLEHQGKVNSVSFSHDDKFIASASDDKSVKLWKTSEILSRSQPQSQKSIWEIQHSRPVNVVHFSPDSSTIISVSDDNTIKLWNSDGKEIRPIDRKSASPISFDFSPHSNILAVLEYSQLGLYSPKGIIFKEKIINNFNSQLNGLNFSPDGKNIAVSSDDGILSLSLDLNELLKRSCSLARDYLHNNPKVRSDRTLCDDIPENNIPEK